MQKPKNPYWLDENELREISEIIKNGDIAHGAEIEKFEKDFARFVGSNYAVAVNSGTAALHVGLEAINENRGGVITTPLSFISTANSILHSGSKPVFVDVKNSSLNLDPKLVQNSINSKTVGILAVHLYGYPIEVQEFKKICKEKGIFLAEDCAQALGTKYRGKQVGTFGEFGAFSFYDSKHLKLGEGGMMVTNKKEIAERANMIRSHGMSSLYRHELLGYNYRFNNILAKIGQIQIKKAKKMITERIKRGMIYKEELDGRKDIEIPQQGQGHSYYRFPILLKKYSKRNNILKRMARRSIDLTIGYPMPIYKQPVFRNFDSKVWMSEMFSKTNYSKNKCQNSEKIIKRLVEMPTDPSLETEQISHICQELKKSLDRL